MPVERSVTQTRKWPRTGASLLIPITQSATPSPPLSRTTPYSMTRCVESSVEAGGGAPATRRFQLRPGRGPGATQGSGLAGSADGVGFGVGQGVGGVPGSEKTSFAIAWMAATSGTWTEP